MFCKYCGKKIDDDSIYCSYCGRRIKNANAVIQLEDLSNRRKEEHKEEFSQEKKEEIPSPETNEAKKINEEGKESIENVINNLDEDFLNQENEENESVPEYFMSESERLAAVASLEEEDTPHQATEITNEEKVRKENEDEEEEDDEMPIPTDVNENDPSNAWKDTKGVWYSKDGKRLLRGGDEPVKEYRVRRGVLCVCDAAFYKNETLREVSFPSGMICVGRFAFNECESLREVFFPKNVTHIGEGAFWGCSKLETISFSEGLLSIGADAFLNCEALRKIYLPESVISIGKGAFDGCTSLSTIYVPKGKVEFFRKKLNVKPEIIKAKSSLLGWW